MDILLHFAPRLTYSSILLSFWDLSSPNPVVPPESPVCDPSPWGAPTPGSLEAAASTVP